MDFYFVLFPENFATDFVNFVASLDDVPQVRHQGLLASSFIEIYAKRAAPFFVNARVFSIWGVLRYSGWTRAPRHGGAGQNEKI